MFRYVRYKKRPEVSMRRLQLALILVALVVPGIIKAQSLKVRGKVVDSSGLVMPGAQVKLFRGETPVQETNSSSTGEFEMSVPSGAYRLEVSAVDFQTVNRNITVTGTTGPLTISMKL